MRFWSCLVTPVALVSVLASGCSGGYPIAPTACDAWCNIDNPLGCNFPYSPFVYDDNQTPADCVSACESNMGGGGTACEPALAKYVDCVKGALAQADCGYAVTDAGSLSAYATLAGEAAMPRCTDEWQGLSLCRSCAGRDCTVCADYCSGQTDPSCVSSCIANMPSDTRCIPAYGAWLDCWKQSVLSNSNIDAGTATDSCNDEEQQYSNCVNCYQGQIESYCAQ